MNQKNHFNNLCDYLFSILKSDEILSVGYNAEVQNYIRFNQSLVRQNTHVDQNLVTLQLQKNKKSLSYSRTLAMNLDQDNILMKELLEQLRHDIQEVPEDGVFVETVNNGTSAIDINNELPNFDTVVSSISEAAKNVDLAGFFAGGLQISANRNSKGQSHWFSTNNYFFDYSLYDGPRAVKKMYSDTRWSKTDLKKTIEEAQQQLELLKKDKRSLKPGAYKVYLAPAAVAEIVDLFSWGGLSATAHKQGFSPFTKLAEGERQLSPKFSFVENFELGLTPQFNSLGEVTPLKTTLIDKGIFKEFLTSTKSAKEYNIASNKASSSEAPRSPEILPGVLKETEILSKLDTGIYISNLHYLNWSDRTAARITGMTRYACFWIENGEIKGPIQDLRFDISLYDVFGENLLDVTNFTHIEPNTLTYSARDLGGKKVPGMLIKDWTFTL